MDSREAILEEVAKIQYIYKMKRVIRYHHTRDEAFDTESVAEHVYGMSVLAEYFLPLEDPEGKWDWQKIRQMILWHDLDEAETGDKIGYLKTPEDRANEAAAISQVISAIPSRLQETVQRLMQEYAELRTPEARFTKAMDRVEPSFHLFNDAGKKILHSIGTTLAQHRTHKDPYVADFPTVRRFHEVLSDEMDRQGFFVTE